MQKIIIDTNVIVSALIQKGFPYKIINDFFIEGKINLCVSEELMREYYDVLRRPKFATYPDFTARAESILAEIETRATMYVPQISLDLLTDKDDNMILELADVCNADFIITGNTNDFTMSAYKNTKIVTPKDFWLYSDLFA